MPKRDDAAVKEFAEDCGPEFLDGSYYGSSYGCGECKPCMEDECACSIGRGADGLDCTCVPEDN